MARTPDGLAPRTVKLSLRVTKSDELALDRQRGDLSRSEYIRALIKRDARNRKG